jgi:hypothetical protein
MRRLTEGLDSSDKGNITEAWYQRAVLGGDGETHVAARKAALAEDQGIKIEKDRFVDIVDGSIAREIKSGDGKLSIDELVQMRDYARLVTGLAVLPTDHGDVTIKHVRYTFTSPAGARANVTTMRDAFASPELAGRITFEVYTPAGVKVEIKTSDHIEKQPWMLE